MCLASVQLCFHFAQGVLATASGSEPVAAFSKPAFKDGFNHHPERRLHHPVGDRGDAQRTLLVAACFGDIDPSDSLGPVVILRQALIHGEQPVLAVFPEELHAYPVHTGSPGVGSDGFPGDPKRFA